LSFGQPHEGAWNCCRLRSLCDSFEPSHPQPLEPVPLPGECSEIERNIPRPDHAKPHDAKRAVRAAAHDEIFIPWAAIDTSSSLSITKVIGIFVARRELREGYENASPYKGECQPFDQQGGGHLTSRVSTWRLLVE
jgi:hypothetical protein